MNDVRYLVRGRDEERPVVVKGDGGQLLQRLLVIVHVDLQRERERGQTRTRLQNIEQDEHKPTTAEGRTEKRSETSIKFVAVPPCLAGVIIHTRPGTARCACGRAAAPNRCGCGCTVVCFIQPYICIVDFPTHKKRSHPGSNGHDTIVRRLNKVAKRKGKSVKEKNRESGAAEHR